MLELLEDLCAGKAGEEAVHTLEELCDIVSQGSLCGLGRTAPNPVISTLKYFRHEYAAHVNGTCPAHKCRALIHFFITNSCIGCTKCAQNCPVGAIVPTPYERHTINPELCIRCGTCKLVCPSEAVEVR